MLLNQSKLKKKWSDESSESTVFGSGGCHSSVRRHRYRQLVDTIRPGTAGRRRKRPESSPNGAVALESGAKGDLPNTVASFNSSLSFRVRQFIPRGGTGCVAEPVQGHPGRLHVPFREVKILFDLVQHSSTSSVDAEMLKCESEVRDVRLDLLLEELAPDESCEEEKLLRDWQHEWA